MTVTLIKKTKEGTVQPVGFVNQIKKLGVQVGQVYLSADGANHGVVVVGLIEQFNNVVVTPIAPQGVSGPDQIMSVVRMAMIDYYLVEPPYIGWTETVMGKLEKELTKLKKPATI
jgi:hypothetical protein